MNEIEIYFIDTSDLAEFEAIEKGFRTDVFVKICNEYFNVNIYDITRLNQDFISEVQDCGYYAIENNLILVNEVKKEIIISTINYLVKQKYFFNIKPTNINNLKLNRIF